MVDGASESSRREYAARMNRVIDHIQANLSEPLNLHRLAAIACFSPFHFHRLFHACIGETLQQFIHRLRLEQAAQLLAFQPAKTISEIALECGFSSSSTFARSFKLAFGATASEWRIRKICQTNSNPWQAGRQVPLGLSNGETSMPILPFTVQVRPIAPVTIAYLRHIGPYKGDVALFRRLFTRLYAWAEPRGFRRPDTRYLSLYQDNPNLTPAARQRLEVALTVPRGTAPSADIGIKTLEGGLYAIATVQVTLQEYAAQWNALVGDWLPGSGYQPDHRPALEFYLNDPDTDPEHRYHLEICLPVRAL